MSTKVAKMLKPPGTSEQITMSITAGTKTSKTTKYTFYICSYIHESNEKSHTLQAYNQDRIPCNVAQIPTAKVASRMPHPREDCKFVATKTVYFS